MEGCCGGGGRGRLEWEGEGAQHAVEAGMGGWGRVGGVRVGGDGRPTVMRKFDSIDSIVDPTRCRCLRLVGCACSFNLTCG